MTNKIIRLGNIYEDKHGYNSHAGRVYDSKGIAPCLKTPSGGGAMPIIPDGTRLRRLTPRECFRLQGWTDDYFEKAQFVNSDTQLYKQAGNGVTVTVIQAIAERMQDDLAEHMNPPEGER